MPIDVTPEALWSDVTSPAQGEPGDMNTFLAPNQAHANRAEYLKEQHATFRTKVKAAVLNRFLAEVTPIDGGLFRYRVNLFDGHTTTKADGTPNWHPNSDAYLLTQFGIESTLSQSGLWKTWSFSLPAGSMIHAGGFVWTGYFHSPMPQWKPRLKVAVKDIASAEPHSDTVLSLYADDPAKYQAKNTYSANVSPSPFEVPTVHKVIVTFDGATGTNAQSGAELHDIFLDISLPAMDL